MPDPHGALEAGQPMYANGFLPAIYQPTMFRPGTKPVLNLDLPEGVTLAKRAKTLEPDPRSEQGRHAPGRQRIRRAHQRLRSRRSRCRPKPRQSSISRRSRAETLEMYGVGEPQTDDYGRRCLLARRLVEKGVRFVCAGLGRRPRQHAVGRPRRYRRESPAHGGADGQADCARCSRI